MLASAVRIDRTIKGQIWRIVAGDDGFRRLDSHFGALRDRHFLIPAVVLDHRTIGGETIVWVGRGAAATGGQWRLHGVALLAVCIYSTSLRNGRPVPFGTFLFLVFITR